jgi:hypothetical protein
MGGELSRVKDIYRLGVFRVYIAPKWLGTHYLDSSIHLYALF